jgi:hypothetical protein
MGHSHATCSTSSPNSPRTQVASQREEIIFWSDFSPLYWLCDHLRGYSTRSIRIQALKQWPLTSSAKELKNLLGGINFYHKFIPSFSSLARPLHHLSNTSSTFIWTKEETTHFSQLKDSLCSSPVLHMPDLSQPFEIEYDTSQYAIGVELKQGGHPIAYHSETLSEAKKNYSTYEKEFYSCWITERGGESSNREI